MSSPGDILTSPEESRIRKLRILRERARLLAMETAAKTQSEEQIEFLEFQAASGKFGVPTVDVLEVCVLKEFTVLPGVPSFILGIMNLRGRILSILDLKKLFDLPSEGLPYHNKAIVIQSGNMNLALLGDDILGVQSIAVKSLQPALPSMTGRRSEYTRGLTPHWTVILDVAKMLEDPRILVDFQLERTT
jgi:purine-binding chemotaxis protein CheW